VDESSEDREVPHGANTSLGAIGQALSAAVNGLREAVDALTARATKSEKRVRGIAVAIVLDLIFTGGFALLYWNQQHTADLLSDTRQQVLCPMFASWLGSYNPISRAPGQDRDTYENVFAQMRAQYEHLQCTTPLVPRPTTTPAPTPTPSPH
jgi:hypothetical protein